MPLVRTRCLLQLLLVVARATHLAIAETSPRGHGGDEAALVAFKAKISGHSGVLDSWNQNTATAAGRESHAARDTNRGWYV
ncbi:unnamed protein product [Urochloa humidicola]